MTPGEVLAGQYRIDSRIAKGGMGEVFSATHLVLRRKVAIKVLLCDGQESHDAAERFLREARAAAQLQSRYVVRILNVDKDESSGVAFIVMEYLTGNDLAHELRTRRKLPVAEAVEYILQACVGIAEAHARGIVHRDLKPGNLFLARTIDAGAEIKVLDFGVSKVMSELESEADLTNTTHQLGSPRYMSPEQVRHSKYVDHRSDIWSLGVILYHLVTGKRPFNGSDRSGVYQQVLAHAPRPVRESEPSVPEQLEALVEWCLQKAPEHRPQSVLEVARALVDLTPEGHRYVSSIERILATRSAVLGGQPSQDPDGAAASQNIAITGLSAETTTRVKNAELPQTDLSSLHTSLVRDRSSRTERVNPRRAAVLAAAAGLVGVFSWSVWAWQGADDSSSATVESLSAERSENPVAIASSPRARQDQERVGHAGSASSATAAPSSRPASSRATSVPAATAPAAVGATDARDVTGAVAKPVAPAQASPTKALAVAQATTANSSALTQPTAPRASDALARGGSRAPESRATSTPRMPSTPSTSAHHAPPPGVQSAVPPSPTGEGMRTRGKPIKPRPVQ